MKIALRYYSKLKLESRTCEIVRGDLLIKHIVRRVSKKLLRRKETSN